MTGIQTLDTLVKTLVADAASFARVQTRGGRERAPEAYRVTEDAMEASHLALYQAARAPLTGPMFWREAPLPNGRKAQVFNTGAGTTCTIRQADGTTEYSMTYMWEDRALEDFAALVVQETEFHGRAR